MDTEALQELVWQAAADLLGRIWPETFLYYLNEDPQEDEAMHRPGLERMGEEELGPGGVRFPNVATARAQQRALRHALDRYLKTKDWDHAVEYVNQKLAKRPLRIYLRTSNQLPPLPPKERRKAAFSLIPTKLIFKRHWDDWVGWARLLTSDKLERLKKCPECGKYFLAKKPGQQKYCTRKCTLRAVDRRYREKHREQYNPRKREAMRLSRQRKKQHTI